MDDIQQKPIFRVILSMKSRQVRQKDVALRHEATPHPKNTSLLLCMLFQGRGETQHPPICDHRPDHMTEVEAAISGLCVSFCREKHTHPPNGLHSKRNQQR